MTGLSYTSEGLQPDTSYSFFIEAFNSAGSTRSAEIMGRTLEGVPSGIAPPILTAVSASSVRAMWTTPTTPNGVITRYELVMVTFELNMTVISELSLSGVVSDLLPFTVYTFLIRACTVTGCGSSETVQVRTLEAPPTFQLRPNVSTLTAVSLFVEWEEPTEPNGVVIQYEVRQREIPFMGSGVFLANVSGDVFAFTVTDLRPFTVYEFSVVAYTAGGGTQSEWQNETTGEAGKIYSSNFNFNFIDRYEIWQFCYFCVFSALVERSCHVVLKYYNRLIYSSILELCLLLVGVEL